MIVYVFVNTGATNLSLTSHHLLIAICRHLKWIIKGVERLETLVSISTDGRVLEWNLKKGLVVSNLMQLKKSGTVSGGVVECVELPLIIVHTARYSAQFHRNRQLGR